MACCYPGLRHLAAVWRQLLLGLSLLFLAGCATQEVVPVAVTPAIRAPVEPVCSAQPAHQALIGQWYLTRRLTGVVGEVQTLLSLSADGKMKQQTRVKQGRNIRSELRETGCWALSDMSLRTRVLRSNGELVDFDDPIYQTTYTIDTLDAQKLVFRESRAGSKPLTAKKMLPSFQLN
jgi:hypothetical protein